MRPIFAKNGEKLLTLKTKWGDYYAASFEGVAGIPVEWTDYSDKIMSEYGKKLGKLHALSSKYKPTIRKQSCFDALDWIENVLGEYKAPDFTKK